MLSYLPPKNPKSQTLDEYMYTEMCSRKMVRGATSLKKETKTIFLVENSIGSEQEIIDYTILPGKMKKSSYICFF